MKTIKVKYVGFWKNFDPDTFFLTQIMKKYYDVKICDDPDYIICSCMGFYEYLGYDQVRIMFSGENYIPDFNYVDYAISTYPIDFQDRHVSFPGIDFGMMVKLGQKERKYDRTILMKKTCFANMIASHESETGLRGALYEKLNQYKRVEAGGTYLNNMPGGGAVNLSDGSKLALARKCKFTICPESTIHNGFITEKIFDAFLADTIPIYCGSPTISKLVNKKAYIDVNDFENIDDVVTRVVELDKDDEKFLEMLSEPVFIQKDYVNCKITELENFVQMIFNQPLNKVFRRSKVYIPQKNEDHLQVCKQIAGDYWNGRFNSLEWIVHIIKQKVNNRLFNT